MDRILSWDKKEQTCWIPTPKTLPVQNVSGVEMFIHQWWAIAILRIKKMGSTGDSTKLFFSNPKAKYKANIPGQRHGYQKKRQLSFLFNECHPVLDEPGEWFLDIPVKKFITGRKPMKIY